MKILLLEDDLILAKEIREYLITNQMECDVAHDGNIFLDNCSKQSYNTYLLDINVPKLNGNEVCKKIRETDKKIPIIMLTAYGEIEDKKEAFRYGADDYLVKPFNLEELLLRINALNRRSSQENEPNEIITIHDLEINVTDNTVIRNGVEIILTPKEYKLLLLLAQANGKVISKKTIADKLWDYHIETNQNTIEVYINFLRKKIDKTSSQKLIHTKVGFGYYLRGE